MELFLFLTVPTIILAYIVFFRKRRDPRYPPGPTGLPIIGNVHQMGKKPGLAFEKWRRQYGDIFSIKLGLDDAVVINDPKLIKELFNDSAASGRYQNHALMEMGGGNYGIVNTEGETWMEQRPFVMRKLREIGFAKTSMEEMLLGEAQAMLEYFQRNTGIPIFPERAINDTVVNSIWSLVCGKKNNWNDGDDCSVLKLATEFRNAIQYSQRSGLFFVPIMKYIIPGLSGWTNLRKSAESLHKCCEEAIVQHKETLDVNYPRDLIDHYLIETEKTNNSQSSFSKEHGMKNLKAVVTDLLVAGNETTSATLSWTLLYLSCHPIAQQKLIEEIRKVVGRSRSPSLADKPNMPYTEALMMEVFRISPVLPLGGPHKMLEDKMFHGYFLPTNTFILSNTDFCLHDPRYWNEPEEFIPERFLSEDGSKLVSNDAFIPFSTGKRKCIGENFAKDTVFLFITSIFQKFEVLPDPEQPNPDFECEEAFAHLPKPFRIVVKELSH